MELKESLMVIDKQPGPTSFDIVRKFKKLYPGAKVGHTGSLDPFASGVLILLTGRATKLSDRLLNADKEYVAKMKFGASTDTLDYTGEVIETAEVPELDEVKVRLALEAFVGPWEQTPPMYSAKKVHGVRLYELARQNIKVPRKSVEVQILEIELLKLEMPYMEYRLRCSKGTYVRVLTEEIAKSLGTLGHLTELRRTSCGDYSLEQSAPLSEVEQDLAGWAEKGHTNYLGFLRKERLVRPTALPKSAQSGSSYGH